MDGLLGSGNVFKVRKLTGQIAEDNETYGETAR